jgi:hypothetical protein
MIAALTGIISFFALNNVTADRTETLARNPELAQYLEQNAIPQDNKIHFGGSIDRMHDKHTGAPIGWQFGISMKCAWPLILKRRAKKKPDDDVPPWTEPTPIPEPHVKRPPLPIKAYPPLGGVPVTPGDFAKQLLSD